MAMNNKMPNDEGNKTLNANHTAYSYDEVFPALPVDMTPKNQTGQEHVQPAISLSKTNRNMRMSSSEITTVLSVKAEERKYDHSDKFGEGESMRTCTQISKETGTSIEFSTSKNKSLTFMITGKPSNVMEAKRRILSNFQTQTSISISIPKEHHRWILGKSGQRLKDLEKNTATKISIPGINEQSDKITVVGNRDGIDKALHEIRVISDEQSKKAFERITVPKIYHPFITGANNENLNQLASETGTRINVPPPSVENDFITIAGEKDGVEAAKNHILSIYNEMEKTCQTISVEVPKWQHKYVIGQRRATISEILQKTGVSVEVPPVNKAVDSITLRGPYKLLGDAIKILYAKATSMKCAELEAPNRIHRLVMGKKGAFVRELQESCKQCHIEFTEDKIRVESEPEYIDEVKNKLQEKIHYYMFFYDIVELEVNPKFFKHIIGKSGVNVNRLKNDYDVQISITENNNSIRMEGAKENVAMVKKELEEQIQKLENEKEREITIHHRHHRTFTSNKREKTREIQDQFNVMILFPNPGETSDTVKIKGQKDNVDRCYKHLTKVVKDMNENSYTIEVPIYKQLHKCIIGRQGANIRKIRDETGTKIDVPPEDDKSDNIVITGRKEQVEEAKERILRLQNEMGNIVSEEVSVLPKLLARRKLLQTVKDECGSVQIKFPPPDSKSDKVIIRGPAEDVAKAKQSLLELAAEKLESCHTIEIRAKPDQHRFLIGKNGVRIRKVRESTNAHIIFPNEHDEDKETITIIGKKEDAEKAKAELESIIEQISNTVEEYVQVNPKYHKTFIVNRGELIHKISEDCGGVIISFPRPNNQSDSRVTVKGNAAGVHAAIQRIEKIVQDLENKYEDDVAVPPKYHKHFVSRKGEVLQSIVSECGGFDHVTISFPRTDIKDSKVLLKGSKEAVLSAKSKILDIVRELEDQITIEVVIPNKDHRTLLRSRTYPTVDDIRRALNVKIVFPDRNTSNNDYQNGPSDVNGHVDEEKETVPRPCDIVQITGGPEACEEAKKMLLDTVPIEHELAIPYSYHSSIIGQKGSVIREIIGNFDVQVDVPNPDLKLDVIKVRGRPCQVEEAKNAILKRKKEIDNGREEWELRSYEIKLNVDPEYHSYIIGRGGEVINKIRSDHGVQISLPKKNDAEQHIITITGFQKDVEAAQANILDIVSKLSSRYREEVNIDRRVHSRMIGSKGRSVKRIMEQFDVEIRFPREGDADQNIVVISGDQERVLECKDHLLFLEEDYLQDVRDVEPHSMEAASNDGHHGNTRRNESGFVVKNAPWDQKAPDTSSIAEFPVIGDSAADTNRNFAPQLESKPKYVWGPRRQ